MIPRLLFATLLVAAAGAAAQPPAVRPQRPSLVVLIVVDQMRTDYIDRGLPHFTGGLRRLATGGAWFREAAYPYLNTVTCAGHSTIGTGALPYRHGMILNAWWDRKLGRSRPCTWDQSEKNIGYGGEAGGGDSARSLLVPTLAETIRNRTGGRAVGISLKPRSAIPLVGRHPTAVVWFDERTGWTTSTAFTRHKIDWLDKYFSANPISADAGKTWEPSLPSSAYEGSDAAVGERFPQGWTPTFPHALASSGPTFVPQWQRSPFSDEYLGRLAAAAVDTLGLGKSKGVDFLAVSFSALDLVGHQFGPASHEVQDLLVRLDRTIGALLEHLDTAVGRDRYVVALSADHGVGTIPEQTVDSGRQGGAQVLAALNEALTPYLGPGKHAIHSAYTDLYFAPGVLSKLRGNAAARNAVIASLKELPAIAEAFFAEEIAAPGVRTDSDPVRRAAALSYNRDRSGDVIIVPRRGWMLSSTSATTHGTLYAHDQRVPVIFYGPGVAPGPRPDPATPADIAATLAALAGIPFKAPDGKPLSVGSGK
jgi:predicted AlkP superfamily pyrophosphatase or phosphodiesterase